ncbi:unnamed protein product [Lampetra fluviatilis]
MTTRPAMPLLHAYAHPRLEASGACCRTQLHPYASSWNWKSIARDSHEAAAAFRPASAAAAGAGAAGILGKPGAFTPQETDARAGGRPASQSDIRRLRWARSSKRAVIVSLEREGSREPPRAVEEKRHGPHTHPASPLE